jgi:hypothetical protein
MSRVCRYVVQQRRPARIVLAKLAIGALVLQIGLGWGAPLARADEQTLVTVLAGKVYPLTIKARELGPEYKAAALSVQGGGGFESLFVDPMRGAAVLDTFGADKESVPAVLRLWAVWTKGDIATVDGGRYYIAYGFDVGALAAREPEWKLPAELSLRLIRVESVIAITPLGDMRPYLGTEEEHESAGAGGQARSVNNLKQLGLAMMMYANDYDDVMPYVQQTKSCFAVLVPYVRDARVSRSPQPETRYLFNVNLGGVRLQDVRNPADVPMFWEESPWPDGSRSVAFVDAHVRTVEAGEWPQIEEKLKQSFPRAAKKPLPPDYGVAEFDRIMEGRSGG